MRTDVKPDTAATTAATMPVSAFGAMPAVAESAPAIPQTSPPPAPQTRHTARYIRLGLYDKVGKTLAMIALTSLGSLLWFVGGFYTLAAARSVGLNTTSLLWWLLPALITAAELWLMPKRGAGWQGIMGFVVILVLDVGTSWQGLTSFAGQTLPLFGGIKLPASGAGLHLTAAVFALVIAFIPEKLARYGLAEIKKIWW